ncbi:MAG: YheT family hydrolase [Cyclobacteriaceae bacterium]
MDYKPSLLFKNGHFNTIYSFLFTKAKKLEYKRITIDTPDQDILDLDLALVGSDTLVILVHGLDGSSNVPYVSNLAHRLNEEGIDALALNQRNCSGRPNKFYRSYHSGKTEDLQTTIEYVLDKFDYKKIVLCGLSLGGNLVLKYVGEKGEKIDSNIYSAIGISVPCNLKDSAFHLDKGFNKVVYLDRMISSLNKKLLIKSKEFPSKGVSKQEIRKIKNFTDFDNAYTGPANGYPDAEAYWKDNSCIHYIKNCAIPTLLLNALDDPFLPASSYPYEIIKANPFLTMETPKHGGHVGFRSSFASSKRYFEDRVVQLINS